MYGTYWIYWGHMSFAWTELGLRRHRHLHWEFVQYLGRHHTQWLMLDLHYLWCWNIQLNFVHVRISKPMTIDILDSMYQNLARWFHRHCRSYSPLGRKSSSSTIAYTDTIQSAMRKNHWLNTATKQSASVFQLNFAIFWIREINLGNYLRCSAIFHIYFDQKHCHISSQF